MVLNKDGWQTCGGGSTVQKQSEELSKKQKKKRAESLQVKENFKKIFHLSEAYPRCYRARRRGTLWTVCQPGRANTERHNHLYLQPMKDHQLN